MPTHPPAGEAAPALTSAIARRGVTGAATLCLAAIPAAAFADDDDVPATPQKLWIGTLLFVLVTAVILVMAVRARLPARMRRRAGHRPRVRIKRKGS